MKRAYVVLAEGFELIEAMTPVDVLKRCGVEVETLSIDEGLEVTSSQGIIVRADRFFEGEGFRDGDLLVLPGGYPGYENIGKHQGIMDLAKYYLEEGKVLGAICGAPSALAKAGLLKGRRVTSHFTVRELLTEAEYIDEKVVVDDNLITSTGAGRSLEFSLALGEALTSREVLEKVKKGMTLL
jgi:4-methyl-5(b-hydroxyethyl)-thiazole monophosphate biosynthesis